MAKQPLTIELYYSGEWHPLALADDGDTDKVMSIRKPVEITRGYADEPTSLTPAATGMVLKDDDGDFNPRNPASALYGVAGRNTPLRIHLGTPHPGAADSSLTASTSHVAPSVDAPTSSGILICAWSGPFPSGSYTAPGGMTESLDQNDATQTMMVARQVISGAGATGSRTATASASESWLACSVLIHGPTSISTGAVGGSTSISVDGTTDDWWIVVSSFGWDDEDITPAAYPHDTDGGGWILLADTGTVNSADSDAAFNRMKVWGKRVKFSNASHTITVESDSSVSTISWLTRIPGDAIDEPWSMRMHGEVSGWAPKRPIKGPKTSDIDVGGVLRRIAAGKSAKLTALQRTLFGLNATATPAAFWPMGSPLPATANTPAMKVADITGSASPDLSWITEELPATGPAFSSAARDIYVRPRQGILIPSSGPVTVDSVVRARPTENTSAFVLSHRFGATQFVNVTASWATGVPTLMLIDGSGTLDTATIGHASKVWDESPHHYRAVFTQDGSDVDITVYLDGEVALLGTTSSLSLSGSTAQGLIPGLIVVSRAEMVWAGVTLWFGSDVLALATAADAALGYPGEVAGRRMLRVCAEAGIVGQVIGDIDDTQPMGPQPAESLAAILTEIERTDDGLIYDLREAAGIALRTGRSLYNQEATLELTYGTDGIGSPLEPVVDDLNTHNDITVTSRAGGSARAVQESGPLNVQAPDEDPDGVGRYEHNVAVNTFSDLVLDDVASWQLHRGTVDETRWPAVTIEVDVSSDLETALSWLEVGDRITIDDHPDSPDLISLIVIGMTETIESHHRRMLLNCIPEAPFHILVVEHDDYSIIGSDSATLAEDLDTTETGVDINCGHAGPWVHEDDYDIRVGGERMTVTAVGAASGTFPDQTQTLTVTRSVNGVAKSHSSGGRVELFYPAHFGY